MNTEVYIRKAVFYMLMIRLFAACNLTTLDNNSNQSSVQLTSEIIIKQLFR